MAIMVKGPETDPVKRPGKRPLDALARLSVPQKIVAAAVALLLVVGLATLLAPGHGTNTITANFSQAVSLYKGSDVDIMGVRVGKVTKIVPEGDHVAVTMEYDDQYKLPAQVKAAVVTPTLVADRFVQLAPAYTGGPTLRDHGVIPMQRTAVPVEMDRIYQSIDQLTKALGPDGANKNGALNAALEAGANALKGNGQLGHDALANLSDAARTVNRSSPQLFATLDSLDQVTQTLNQNDATVQAFLTNLGKVSAQLGGESQSLQKALAAIAQAVSVTRDFVKNNKDKVTTGISDLTTTLNALAQQKDTLNTVLQLAPLGLTNLTDSFDTRTGTEGIRLQIGPNAMDLGNILCAIVTNDKIPNAGAACTLFKALLPASLTSAVGAGITSGGVPSGSLANGAPDLGSLLGLVTGLLGGKK